MGSFHANFNDPSMTQLDETDLLESFHLSNMHVPMCGCVQHAMTGV